MIEFIKRLFKKKKPIYDLYDYRFVRIGNDSYIYGMDKTSSIHKVKDYKMLSDSMAETKDAVYQLVSKA